MVRSLPSRLLLALVLVSLLCTVPAAPAAAKPCANQNLMPSQDNIPQIRSATLCLINKERTRRGRRALRASGHLRNAAQSYSEQMVRESFFDHVTPGGTTLLSRIRRTTGYLVDAVRYSLGENLAWGSGELATPRQTVIAWMRSPGHRRNMLDKRFRHVGVGVAIGAPTNVDGMPAATYTTEFGRRS